MKYQKFLTCLGTTLVEQFSMSIAVLQDCGLNLAWQAFFGLISSSHLPKQLGLERAQVAKFQEENSLTSYLSPVSNYYGRRESDRKARFEEQTSSGKRKEERRTYSIQSYKYCFVKHCV